MKSFVKTSFLIAFIFIIGSVLPVHAQYFIDPSIELEPIVISAQRVVTSQNRVAENIEVYDSEDLADLPAKDLGEALRFVPGVDVVQSGGFGASTALSIQGSNSRHTRIMVDGIPFNTQASGQANPSKLPFENAQQIEVVKGASSSAWGSSLGGVINVITKEVTDSETPVGSFTTSYGEYATTKNMFEVTQKTDLLGYYFFGSYLNSHGHLNDGSTDEGKVFFKVERSMTDVLKVISSIGHTDSRVRFRREFNTTINEMPSYTTYGQLKFLYEKDETFVSAAFKYNYQDIQTNSYNTVSKSTTFSRNHSYYKGFSLIGSQTIRENDQLVAGFDFNWDRLKTPDQLGGNSYISESIDLKTFAPYMNYTLRLGQFDIIPGARFDSSEEFGDELSPSLGAVYHFNDHRQTLLRTKVAKDFNAPPLLWRYNDDGVWTEPNPDLEPERGTIFEAGIKSNITAKTKVKVNWYLAQIKDFLQLDPDDSTYPKKMVNVGKVKKQGGDVSLHYDVTEQISVYATAAFNHVKNKDTNKVVRGTGIPRQSFRLGFDYKANNGWGLNIFGYYDRWNNNASDQPNVRKFIVDAKVSKEIKEFYRNMDAKFFLNVRNLGNSDYWSSRSYPLYDRYFEAGLTLKF